MPEPHVRHEVSDLHARGVLVAAALIAGGIAFALAAAWFISWGAGVDRAARTTLAPPSVPAPQQGSAPRLDLGPYQREKKEQLERYGWVDQHAGRIHIPIERAMQLLAEEQEKNK